MDALSDGTVQAIREGEVLDRVLWAGLAAIVGAAVAGTTDGMLTRLETTARAFAVPPDRFDDLAARFDLYYHRPSDCYLSREGWLEARRQDASMFH